MGLRISWAMGVVAPWCLGVGLVVSMAADAGQDAVIGASVAPHSILAITAPGDLIPATVSGAAFGLDPQRWTSMQAAGLSPGDRSEFDQMPEEIQPRIMLKAHVHGFPETDRSHRGDPTVGLRPTFGSQLERSGGLAALRTHQMIFADAETFQSDVFVVGAVPPTSGASGFTAWPEGENPTTAPASGAASPTQTGSAETYRPANINERFLQGATPEVARAMSLASTTPAPADATPVEVVALPTIPGGVPVDLSAMPSDRPDYAALIGEDQSQREEHCLAQAIYFEARSESEKGQAAVAQVVLNRVSSGLYPPTICGVVFQNRQYYHACQFSFACEGRSLRVTEPEAWRRAEHIAAAVTSGQTYVADVGDATHYHALYVHPYWARRLQRTDRIGQHVFYKLRPGQS
ncbi:MAG: cell wall hydrolase [Methylovirgula sp.]|uniref:cell wall hydrolase n=1 Tax=Methylovirgula sp. TaxID=1978224 RepID=UPI003075FCAD